MSIEHMRSISSHHLANCPRVPCFLLPHPLIHSFTCPVSCLSILPMQLLPWSCIVCPSPLCNPSHTLYLLSSSCPCSCWFLYFPLPLLIPSPTIFPFHPSYPSSCCPRVPFFPLSLISILSCFPFPLTRAVVAPEYHSFFFYPLFYSLTSPLSLPLLPVQLLPQSSILLTLCKS